MQQFDAHQFSLQIQIGHNRWATHGAKSILNAHPRRCTSIKFNSQWNYENFEKIRDFLIQNGFSFTAKPYRNGETFEYAKHYIRRWRSKWLFSGNTDLMELSP